MTDEDGMKDKISMALKDPIVKERIRRIILGGRNGK